MKPNPFDNGGPAFPSHIASEAFEGTDARNRISGGGMSRRDYFAVHILQGLLANPVEVDLPETREGVYDYFAVEAVGYADALLAVVAKLQQDAVGGEESK